jgi:molybdenum cofactor cytidylyltransferase
MTAQPEDRDAVIVLAAGRSSRMGAHKLLLPLGEAPVIVRSVRRALASGLRPVVVVIGHGGEQVRAALATQPVTITLNPQYHEGIASSLRSGVGAVDGAVSGAVITLGDQPLLPAAHLAALAAHARQSGAAIVATRYPDHRGSPIYFARQAFAELLRLTGDQGARSLMSSGTYGVVYLPLQSPDAALDVDTPADYERAQRAWERSGER